MTICCGMVQHKNHLSDIQFFYDGKEYRDSLEGGTEADRFYKLHDRENLDKFQYTGTDVFRQKTIMDIGARCGSFLDFVREATKKVIARSFRNIQTNYGRKSFCGVWLCREG